MVKRQTRRNFLTGAFGATLAGIGAALLYKKLDPITYFKDLLDNEPFEYTGKQTTGGYDIFRVKDIPDSLSQRNKSEISDRFDQWDAKKGDNYANTGYSNIRTINSELVVVAQPTDEERVSEFHQKSKGKKEQYNTEKYTKVDRGNYQVKKDLQTKKYNSTFLDAIDAMCGRLDMHAMGLLSVMSYETGGSFRPDEPNKNGSGARGLIQFMPQFAHELGKLKNGKTVTITDLERMSQMEQLEYVERYFNNKRKHRGKRVDFSRAVNIALTVFYPDYLDKLDTPIAYKGSITYKQNDFDKDNKGFITGRDYAKNILTRGYLVK